MCHAGEPLGAAAGNTHRSLEWAVRASDGASMPTFLAVPSAGSGPVVVVAGDMYGRSPFYEELCRRLAAAGFVAACPDLFFREGPVPLNDPEAARERWRSMDEVRALTDLEAVLDQAAGMSNARGSVRGTMGFCLGGTQVLNLAARRRDVATVCFYGFPQGSAVSWRPAPPPLDELSTVGGPVLGLWGDHDQAVGSDNVDRYVGALRDREVDILRVMYPGAGHGFMAAAAREPSAVAEERAADAWERSVSFLTRHLLSGRALVD
jgi:carboxymethylenebutenolidase